jgi:hypothetical protein
MTAELIETARTPLEDFIRDYIETLGGDWDEVEPQVYDVLLPHDSAAATGTLERGMLRMAFDPEALPEHPGAQLASFGTPLVDGLLADAVRRGRFARLYMVGLNLAPHDLNGRVRRGLTLGTGQRLEVRRMRPLHFTQAIYFFQAAFISDQKEQEMVPVGLDLHYGRETRHLEELLDPARLSDRPVAPLADARRLSLAAGFPVAQERVLRTLAAMANTRSRELHERLDTQVTRMTKYYADLRQELDDHAGRGKATDEATERLAARRAALDREERLRVTELRQKNSLRLELRLVNLLAVQQPKLLVSSEVISEKAAAALELVWDPLTEALEAPPCPSCGRPGYALELTRQGKLVCPTCSGTSAGGRR